MTHPTPDYARVTETGIYGFFGAYAFLSNFTPSFVRLPDDLVMYPTVENAYQAAKTFDIVERQGFHSCSPGEAKKLGRKITLRADWEQVKYSLMLGLVFQKFHCNQPLQDKLVATGGLYLEETNHWGDNIWGVDYRGDIGTNWLGMILMDVRKCFKSLDHVKKKFDKY